MAHRAGGVLEPPTVTIGMPVYNAERFLAETLDALLAQTRTDFEIVISDNSSTDQTAAICRRYADRDRRIRYYRNDVNRGAAYNYNRVVELALGEYFKWASYDDLLAPQHLEACLSALKSRPDAVLAYPKTVIINEDGEQVRLHEDELELLEATPWGRLRTFTWRWSLCNPVFGLIRTEVLRRTRMIEPHVSSDVTLLADLCIRGCFLEVPERLFFRRIHATTSRQGRLTRQEVATWFDPRRRPSPLSNRTVVLLSILGVILHSTMGPVARMRTLVGFLSAWTLRRVRVRGGQVKASLQRVLATPSGSTVGDDTGSVAGWPT